MATNWNNLKHKSSPEVREALKREAHAELERVGFGKLRQARQKTQAAIAERLKIAFASGRRGHYVLPIVSDLGHGRSTHT